jgi:chromosomal replication initiation ATPase DnaA
MSAIMNVPVDTLQVIVKMVEDTQRNLRALTGLELELVINFPKGTELMVEAGWLKLQQLLCRYSGLTWHDIIVANRSSELVMLRAAYCYLGRQIIGSRSLKKIGRDIGNRDHTTVIHLTGMFANMLETGHTPSIAMYAFIKNEFAHETKTNSAAI